MEQEKAQRTFEREEEAVKVWRMGYFWKTNQSEVLC